MSEWRKTARFLTEHVTHDSDECLIWPYGRDGGGYARAKVIGYDTRLAHRIMCEMVNGPAGFSDALARHLCGRGRDGCVNPKHLAWGTAADNSADMVTHGTRQLGEQTSNSVLTENMVKAIRAMVRKGRSQRDIASLIGVHHATVQAVSERRTWKHID